VFKSSTAVVPEISKVPQHVAIIMDGNGRWAQARGLPRVAGHKKGADAVRAAVKACVEQGVKYLTLFAFSSENWRRPAEEVGYLLGLFLLMLKEEVRKLHQNGVRFKVAGDLSAFSADIQQGIRDAETLTANNTALTLTVAANYGGRWDITQATNHALAAGKQPLQVGDIDPYLAMAHAPEPDLFIRTGGEQRISNFLLWQLAYTELYFTEQLWPDFDSAALQTAIASYQQRERRFGRTSAQVQEAKS
jgi:undecaprenyl diphosphate synthase